MTVRTGAQSLKSAPPHGLPPVMMLADHFGYPGGVPHGVTSYLLNVLPALRAAGIDLTVCFLREPHEAANALREHGINPVFFAASKWDPFVALRIARLARRRGVSLLHSTGLKCTFMARIAARLAGACNVLHVHDLNEPGRLLSGLQSLFARCNDFGVCVSEAARDLTVHRYHVATDRVRVIHNGIRVQEIAEVEPGTRARVRRELELSPDQPVVAMIGRMYRVKGHRAMLQMLPAITQQCSGLTLLLVGDGPERAGCERLVSELQLQAHVRFLGARSDIAQLLAAVDLLVMPSESEGLGLAAIESLAAGKPVVAFAVGGLREVVEDRVTGRLVRPGDYEAFVSAVVETIRDPAQLAAYAQRAVLAAERFSVDEHVRRLIDCYREVAAAR